MKNVAKFLKIYINLKEYGIFISFMTFKVAIINNDNEDY
jgi:hypothetical protein